ncbi:hypothetical protein PCCS19_07580 [Paenibacillus sp. CCS19]|uniref:TcaA NTF2-like domain-containing protein n=1 Tax=Paenibacillus sp. CCS19 TaxID=3158387 RepID=UPI0025678BA9|nr:hypothetical protein [Paenibacillus cellulosilyticus]GMK37704.1 hypothetical protein PCCS19_07580 [Paenibacillus cellulosilyticus]
MRTKVSILITLALFTFATFNNSFNSVTASEMKQADACQIVSDSGSTLVIGDHYLGHADFYVFCGGSRSDGDLADQAIFNVNPTYLNTTKKSAGRLSVTAKEAGNLTVRATMPDKSVVSYWVTVMTKLQYDKVLGPKEISIDEALILFRMKFNDVNGEYGYSRIYSDGSYVFSNQTREESLGESEIFRVDPITGTVYGYLDDEYVDNLMLDKHDPPYSIEQSVQLLKQRFLKKVPANQTVEATGNYSKGCIEIGVFSLVKSAETGKMVANYHSHYTTYLVDPATGDVFNANPSYAYKGSISTTKVTRTKNRSIYYNDMLQDYYRSLSSAVNDNNLRSLESILRPDSSIDKQQRQFAKSMYTKGTKEQFGKTYKIDHTEQVSSKIVKIYVEEETSVTPKNGKNRIVKEKWMYQAEKEAHVWRFTAMSRW